VQVRALPACALSEQSVPDPPLRSAAIDVEVPLEFAWSLWEDKEQIPQFMGWITKVEVWD